MFNLKISLFSHTKELEQKIDILHDKILEISLVFKKSCKCIFKRKKKL